jgi:glycogen debranching enzyme
MQNLIDEAKDILIKNDRGDFTVPSPHLYPHLWAWDSAFAAMGWAHIDMDRAQREIDYLLNTQWENGMVPHITFDQAHLNDYFPGPDVWEHPLGSTISQPPVWAMAVEYLFKRGADEAWVRSTIDKIKKTHDFFHTHRDPQNKNLIAIAHPWESGMDNCVAWDVGMDLVPNKIRNELKRVDKEKVADAAERPTDDQYLRYLHIVESLVDNQFIPTVFKTYDPMMTTLLVLGEEALARVCDKLEISTGAQARADKMKEALLATQTDSGYYTYHNAVDDKTYNSPTLGSLFPLLVDAEFKTNSAYPVLEKHIGEFGLSSHQIKDTSFDEKCYWRGPTWINTNYLFSMIDKRFKEYSIDLIKKSGFREYYNPLNGDGLGATQFTWSAALFLCMVNE